MQGGAGEEGEDGEAGSFQAYSNPGESSGGYADLDIPAAASTASQNDELGGGMGSMTGWRAIAAQVSSPGHVCLVLPMQACLVATSIQTSSFA